MPSKVISIILIIFACLQIGLEAQNDSLDTVLPTAIITKKRKENLFVKNIQRDSFPTQLSQIIAGEPGLFSRSLGAGTSVTTGVRGGNANQMAVIWNGLQITNPMLGVTDMSLLAPFSFQTLQLDKGGSASQGEGMSGTLSLNSEVAQADSSGISAYLQIGSFQRQMQALSISSATGKIRIRTSFHHKRARNNFKYTLPGNINGQLSNAAHRNYALHQDLTGELSKHLTFGLHFWHQHTYREVPPSIVQNRSEAWQRDIASRMTGYVQGDFNKLRLRYQSGFTNEELLYVDPANAIKSPSLFSSFQNLLVGSGQIKNHLLKGSASFKLFTGDIPSYWSPEKQQNYHFQLQDTWNFDRGHVEFGISMLGQNNQKTFVLPFFSLLFSSPKGTIWQLRGEQQVRFPTMNDLYWVPGGNPALQAESGWSTEFGFSQKINKLAAAFQATFFYRQTQDQILWAPDAGTSFWKPQNISETQAIGAELSYNQLFNLGHHLTLKLETQYAYTSAITLRAIDRLDIPKGQQLWYTPIHQFSNVVHLDWKKKVGAQYRHTFSDGVTGPFGGLPAQHLGAVQFNFELTKWHTSFFFDVYNIWDALLFTQENRIAPGRHYAFTLRTKIN